MVSKRPKTTDDSPFLRADLSRNIFVQNKQKLMVAPVFLRDGLLSEVRERKRRRRAVLRRWVTWTSSLGFGALLIITGVRQSGLMVPLNVAVALEVPVPQVNEQVIASADITLSEGIQFPTTTPQARLKNQAKVTVPKQGRELTVPIIAQVSGAHSLSISFYRADGTLVASRVLDIKSSGQIRSHSESLNRVTSSMHAFALLLRPTLFITKVIPYQESMGRDFRASLAP